MLINDLSNCVITFKDTLTCVTFVYNVDEGLLTMMNSGVKFQYSSALAWQSYQGTHKFCSDLDSISINTYGLGVFLNANMNITGQRVTGNLGNNFAHLFSSIELQILLPPPIALALNLVWPDVPGNVPVKIYIKQNGKGPSLACPWTFIFLDSWFSLVSIW